MNAEAEKIYVMLVQAYNKVNPDCLASAEELNLFEVIADLCEGSTSYLGFLCEVLKKAEGT